VATDILGQPRRDLIVGFQSCAGMGNLALIAMGYRRWRYPARGYGFAAMGVAGETLD